MIKKHTKLSFSETLCPVCDSDNVFEYRAETNGIVYDLIRCARCGNEETVKTTPVPEEPRKIYVNVEDLE